MGNTKAIILLISITLLGIFRPIRGQKPFFFGSSDKSTNDEGITPETIEEKVEPTKATTSEKGLFRSPQTFKLPSKLKNIKEDLPNPLAYNPSYFSEPTAPSWFRSGFLPNAFSDPKNEEELQNDPFLQDILETEQRYNLSGLNDQIDPYNYNEADLAEEIFDEINRQLGLTVTQNIQGKAINNSEEDETIGEDKLEDPEGKFSDLDSSMLRTSKDSETSTKEEEPDGRGSMFSSIWGAPASIAKGATGLFKKRTGSSTTTEKPEPSTTKPASVSKPQLKCRRTQTEYQGSCRRVLSRSVCSETEWLVEDHVTKMGKCVPNSCPKERIYPLGDLCVELYSTEGCNPGMVSYSHRNGTVECDCEKGYIFNIEDGNCYKGYRQGPCPEGKFFGLPCSTSIRSILFGRRNPHHSILRPKCMRNECGDDRYVCNAPRCATKENCVELGSSCMTKRGEEGRYEINIDLACSNGGVLPVECRSINSRILTNVPSIDCAKGSRRDSLGICRKPTNVDLS